MYKCPHCKAYCYSLWRRLFSPRQQPITCRSCGGQARIADTSVVVEAIIGQVVAIPLVFAFLLLPWWGSTLLVAATIVGLSFLLGVVFPLVPLEPFGSRADVKRANVHLWLVAIPLGLLTVVLLCIGISRALANAA